MAGTGWDYVGPLLVLTLISVIIARYVVRSRKQSDSLALAGIEREVRNPFNSVLLRTGDWESGDGPPVTVKVVRDPSQAHIIRLQLESAGIPVFLADENLIATDWFYSFAVGGVKVQVPAPFVDRAKSLLVEAERNARMRADDEFDYIPAADNEPPIDESIETIAGGATIVCPECSSDDAFRDRDKRRLVAFISILFLGLPALIPGLDRNRYVCGKCGHHWKQTAD